VVPPSGSDEFEIKATQGPGVGFLGLPDVEMNRLEAAGSRARDIALLIVHEDAGACIEEELVEHNLIRAGVWLQDI
jgi:hypothetical protein